MGRISIIEGSACGHPVWPQDRTVVRLPARAGRFAPHQLIRAALPAIRHALNAQAFAALVAPSQAALSIVFAGLRPALSEPERCIARNLSSRLSSHLSHNGSMQELLWDAYVEFLRAAHAVSPLLIIVEDLRQLDANSVALLLQLFRAGADRAPDVVVGYTVDLPEFVRVDERGLVWDISIGELRRSLCALRRLAHETNEVSGANTSCGCPIDRDVWDRSPEQVVEQLLVRAPGTLTASEAGAIAPAIRDVFATFAFDTALRLALAVLDAGLPISPADRSTVCGVAALSAHNRQFFSRGNQRIARFLLETYREALAHEPDPDCRISLYYRLAVTHCRRLNDTGSARQVVDAGFAELARAEMSMLDRRLQEAWLHNIDALVRVRAGDLARAFACCEHAYCALDGVVANEHVASAEVELSKLVINENALTLASMTSDEPMRERWLMRARDAFESWPSLSVVDVLEQQRARIDRLEIAEAYALGITALDLVRTNLNPLLEYFVLVSLSDLAFRLADHDAAADYSEHARALGEEVGDINQTQLALELRAADIATARGRLDEAERGLRALSGEGDPSTELLVEIWGRLAGLYARRGEHASALALIEQTIEAAADSGELDLLLRTSCHAGDVVVLLGMTDDARAAYDNCFELLGDTEMSTPARELLRLKAVVGRQRMGVPDASQLETCLQRLPRLLVQELEAWPLARELVSGSLFDEEMPPECEPVLETVLKALAIRERVPEALSFGAEVSELRGPVPAAAASGRHDSRARAR